MRISTRAEDGTAASGMFFSFKHKNVKMFFLLITTDLRGTFCLSRPADDRNQ